jgi:hypothetical protein
MTPDHENKSIVKSEPVWAGRLSVCLLVWFLCSSLFIAWQKPLQFDDGLFAAIPKNFLNDYGWATSYGERIPFNPDVSTGPTMLIPAAAIIAIAGNQPWVPAVTGFLIHAVLLLLIICQIRQLFARPAVVVLGLLLSISLFTVNDFKTLTGYYMGSLLFLFALLIVVNDRYGFAVRYAGYGALAAIALYGKPLALLSFLAAAPVCVAREMLLVKNGRTRLLLLAAGSALLAFSIVLMPWHVFKSNTLKQYPQEFQQQHQAYGTFFFEYHGSGVAHFRDAPDKIVHLKKNTQKNFRILARFLKDENSYPVWLAVIVLVSALVLAFRRWLADQTLQLEYFVPAVLACVVLANGFWFCVISFAMTPGHTFFLVFDLFLILFLLIGCNSRRADIAVAMCILVVPFFHVRLPDLARAYSFTAGDGLFSNSEMMAGAEFLDQGDFRYPLAGCGYHAGPRRLDYLMKASGSLLDCYNLMEDSLVLDEAHYRAANSALLENSGMSPREHFFMSGKHREVKAKFSWREPVDFTLAFEAFNFIGSVKGQRYLLEPIAETCKSNVLYQTQYIYVCEVPFESWASGLDPDEVARSLVKYRSWYRTRIPAYGSGLAEPADDKPDFTG